MIQMVGTTKAPKMADQVLEAAPYRLEHGDTLVDWLTVQAAHAEDGVGLGLLAITQSG
jgi:hypothetical protein